MKDFRNTPTPTNTVYPWPRTVDKKLRKEYLEWLKGIKK